MLKHVGKEHVFCPSEMMETKEMTLEDILQDIHALEQDLQSFERRYGVLSETFYESYINGEEPEVEAWVKDWSAWAGTYEIWLRRKEQ